MLVARCRPRHIDHDRPFVHCSHTRSPACPRRVPLFCCRYAALLSQSSVVYSDPECLLQDVRALHHARACIAAARGLASARRERESKGVRRALQLSPADIRRTASASGGKTAWSDFNTSATLLLTRVLSPERFAALCALMSLEADASAGKRAWSTAGISPGNATNDGGGGDGGCGSGGSGGSGGGESSSGGDDGGGSGGGGDEDSGGGSEGVGDRGERVGEGRRGDDGKAAGRRGDDGKAAGSRRRGTQSSSAISRGGGACSDGGGSSSDGGGSSSDGGGSSDESVADGTAGDAEGRSELTVGLPATYVRLERAMSRVVGAQLALDWGCALCEALGFDATPLQLLTALASQVNTGLRERLALIFALHAGSRDACLGADELRTLTRTLVTLSLAPEPSDNNSCERRSSESQGGHGGLGDSKGEEEPATPVMEGATLSVDSEDGTSRRPLSEASQRFRRAALATMSVGRLNRINELSKRWARLLARMSNEHRDGLSLADWQLGCLSQPEILHVFAALPERPRPALAALIKRL